MALSVTESLLHIALEAAVPLAIADFQRAGRPWPSDLEQARAFAEELACKGDQLLFRDKETTVLFNGLVHALAVLAFQPGGVHFGGVHWESHHVD